MAGFVLRPLTATALSLMLMVFGALVDTQIHRRVEISVILRDSCLEVHIRWKVLISLRDEQPRFSADSVRLAALRDLNL